MNISVVIPAYNEEKYIGRCLQALNNQSIQADEVIVVDNNCSDKTASIAKEYGARVIKEKMQGMTPARNTGYDAAKGDIIARTDADTVAPPDWIQSILLQFRNNTVGALSGPAYFYDFPFKAGLFYRMAMGGIRFLMGGRNHLNGPNYALTKNVWKRVRKTVCLDDKLVHEDIDLSIHIHAAGGYIHWNDKFTVGVSARKLKRNPFAYFIEYPKRTIQMLESHNLLLKRRY